MNVSMQVAEALQYWDEGGTDVWTVEEMRDSFGSNSYNILCQNCNHFAEAFSLRLLGVGIPAYVNRIAYMGSFFSCLLPKELLEGKINNTSTVSYNWNAWG